MQIEAFHVWVKEDVCFFFLLIQSIVAHHRFMVRCIE